MCVSARQNPLQGKKQQGSSDVTNGNSRTPLASQNGNSAAFTSNNVVDPSPNTETREDSFPGMKGVGYPAPIQGPGPDNTIAGSIKEGANPADIPLDPSGGNKRNGDSNKRTTAELYGADPDDVSSKWIHRDKLARIENEELQAAGIIFPKPRARSKPPRDLNLDKVNGSRRGTDTEGQSEARSRKNSSAVSEPKTPDLRVPSWDLRLPEEVDEDADPYFVVNHGVNGSSRIPVAKLSPVPVPIEHIARDVPISRKRDGSPGTEDSISYPKTRSRSGSSRTFDTGWAGAASQPKRAATDVSPKKNAGGARKASGPKGSGSNGRHQTRGGQSKDSTSSSGGQTRPSTRSGERELSPSASNKQPEGEPPWMVSAYRPDPRLPPDQQLLPTVARRLQQEKWEREGKFGNIYDREFRPLTDEGYLPAPDTAERSAGKEPEKPEEWPLRPEVRSATPSSHPGRTGSYSTIPKIQEKPTVSPLASPRGPMLQRQESPAVPVRIPEPPEEEQKKGCGCCIVM